MMTAPEQQEDYIATLGHGLVHINTSTYHCSVHVRLGLTGASNEKNALEVPNKLDSVITARQALAVCEQSEAAMVHRTSE